MTIKALFTPCQAGVFDLAHRIVLAPMTRIRATEHTLAPNALTTEYYRQRATQGGLLITEATHISPEATPVWTIYPAVREHGGHVPGIWTDEQTLKWKAVTEAVHARGAKISCQLLHTGRVAQPSIGEHPMVKGSGLPLPPVSSSAVPIEASAEEGNQYNWDQESVTPRALTTNGHPLKAGHPFACHSERSKESRACRPESLRCAQNDKKKNGQSVPP